MREDGTLRIVWAIGGLMLLLYPLPEWVKHVISINYQTDSLFHLTAWLRFYTSLFVHYSPKHLVGNLLIFGLSFFLLFKVAEMNDDLPLFRRFVLFAFGFVPVLIGPINFILGRTLNFFYGGGFSSIDMAFVGALPYFTARLLNQRFDFRIRPWILTLGFLLMFTTVITFIYSLTVLWVALLISTLGFLFDPLRQAFRGYGDSMPRQKVLLYLLGVFAINVIIIIEAFPREIFQRSSVIDVASHYLSLLLAMYLFPWVDGSLVEKDNNVESEG